MAGIWGSAHHTRQLATALLGAALVAIAAIFFANQKAIEIQGPSTVRSPAAGTLWLAVNDELWVLDAQGHRTQRHPVTQLGLTEGVSNIALAPGTQALLTSRGDAAWQVVDTATLARVRTITPQWPADMRDRSTRAIHIAISPQWDIAVATGGSHDVLLFDGEGRFKGRTAPGTYYFTNGLWWTPQGWWTTDTNRFALHLLDAQTLAVQKTLRLKFIPGGYIYLGEAIASAGAPLPGETAPPIGTITRLGRLMEPGHAVDVFADGRQAIYNREPMTQLRDIAWFGQSLLVVDGGTYSIQRYAADRTPLGEFGDDAVRASFQQMLVERTRWMRLGSRYGFAVAALLLLGGIVSYARHRRLLVRATVAQRTAGRTVAQREAWRKLVWQRLRIFAVPIAVRFAAALLGFFTLAPWLVARLVPAERRDDVFLLAACELVGIFVPVFVVAVWQQRRHEELMRDPRFEATLNQRAVAWLADHDDWDRIKRDGEVPRETVLLPGGVRPRWLLVTNQRLLLFIASSTDRRLVAQWPRESVEFAGLPAEWSGAAAFGAWQRFLMRPRNLLVVFAGGERLALRCASTVTALRIAALLTRAPAQPVAARRIVHASAPRRWREVVASFVVPGSGQWLQGRFVTGVLLFTVGLLLCAFDWGPVAWATSGPKMHVSLITKTYAVLAWLTLAIVAALDAFHFSRARM